MLLNMKFYMAMAYLTQLTLALPLIYSEDSLETTLLSQISIQKLRNTRITDLYYADLEAEEILSPSSATDSKDNDNALQQLFGLGEQSRPIGKILDSSSLLKPMVNSFNLYQGKKFVRFHLFKPVSQLDLSTAPGVNITEVNLIQENKSDQESENAGRFKSRSIPLSIFSDKWRQYLTLNDADLKSDITVENPQEIQLVISYNVDLNLIPQSELLLTADGLLDIAEFFYEDEDTKKQSRIEFSNYDLLILEHDVSNKPLSNNRADIDSDLERAPKFSSSKLWRRAMKAMVLV